MDAVSPSVSLGRRRLPWRLGVDWARLRQPPAHTHLEIDLIGTRAGPVLAEVARGSVEDGFEHGDEESSDQEAARLLH